MQGGRLQCANFVRTMVAVAVAFVVAVADAVAVVAVADADAVVAGVVVVDTHRAIVIDINYVVYKYMI